MTQEIIRDRYQIRQQLGKKAGRKTLLAYDLEKQDFVVIKILTFLLILVLVLAIG